MNYMLECFKFEQTF